MSLLMPKATAVWLIDNTCLSFEQIADFCGIHLLEIQAIADGDAGHGMIGFDPVKRGQLDKDEIERVEKDPKARLKMSKKAVLLEKSNSKKSRYTPVSRRQDRPNAIVWLLKHHPELTVQQMIKLIGTTKETIEKIRNKTHWNMFNLVPRNPVMLGLCSFYDLEKQVVISKGHISNQQDTQDHQNSSSSKDDSVFFQLNDEKSSADSSGKDKNDLSVNTKNIFKS